MAPAKSARKAAKRAKKKAKAAPQAPSFGQAAVARHYGPGGRLRPEGGPASSVLIKKHTTVAALLDDVRAVVASQHGVAWAERVIDWESAAAARVVSCS